jgi:putative addiction module CopG family antidote
MEIRLRPDLEDLIKQDVQQGSYKSVDEFVKRAVSMLHEQEVWLARKRAEIGSRINEGYAGHPTWGIDGRRRHALQAR